MNSVNYGKGCRVHLYPSCKPTIELAQEKVAEMELQHRDDAFFLADLGDIAKKYEKWAELLPRVEPFYAVKCNQDHAVLKLLAHMGASFDCASKDEVARVLKLGVEPTRIVYANPCKQTSFIRYAAKANVKQMTFDNEAELYKIKGAFPKARLILRILPPANFKVQCELGNKFGCHPRDARRLLAKAQELSLNVIGVSFHVGSGVAEAAAFSAAVETAADVFDTAATMGFNFTLLDIGGGFPGHANAPITFDEIAAVLNESLNKYFPPRRNVRIIAEPGRYFVASAFNLCVNVIAKRTVATHSDGEVNDKGAFMYYVNDGVYGSFNCLLYDHAEVKATLVNAPVNPMEFRCSVWGPTCDGLDGILKDTRLPELCVGDYLNFPDMGAYSMCAGSTFNGMPRPDCFYHCTEKVWNRLYAGSQKGLEVTSPVTKSLPMLKAGHELEKVDIDLCPASPIFVLDEDDGFFH